MPASPITAKRRRGRDHEDQHPVALAGRGHAEALERILGGATHIPQKNGATDTRISPEVRASARAMAPRSPARRRV